MRLLAPSASLVIDTNIVISAVMGAKSSESLIKVGICRTLIATTEMAREASLVIDRIAPGKTARLAALLAAIEVIETTKYALNLVAASRSLRDAPASKNGSERDAHILALAWTYDADIWSHDRDFAGTGWPSWSSANLTVALAEEAGASQAHPS